MIINLSRWILFFALGLSLVAAPFACNAQDPGKVWRVGFLSPNKRPASIDADVYGAFPRGMRELGYVEGKNLVIEWRFADSQYERIPALAAELVRIQVDVIVTAGTPAARAVQKATTTIPLVMGSINDPLGSGLVRSLARPGGNTTGLSNITDDISPKQLEILLGVVPKLSRLAVLANPANASDLQILKNIRAAAHKADIEVLALEVQTAEEIEKAFPVIVAQRAGALIMTQDSFFSQQRRQIAELAVKYRLPSIYTSRPYADAGGLMTYGQNPAYNFERAAAYVDRIFRGAKPGDLPVEQPTKLELIINNRTAKALGLAIPADLLRRADHVIE